MLIRNPLKFRYPIVDLDNSNIKESIDNFLRFLISSNKYDSIADEELGFCLEDFRYEDFQLVDYQAHPHIKAEVAV